MRSLTLYNTLMRAEIICIGTELLLGHIVNTNAAYLSKGLAEIGIDVFHQVTVGDNPKRLIEAIKQAAFRSDIVITTGGLGPTVDDITMAIVAKLLCRDLILDKIILKDVKSYFKSRHLKFPRESIRQAYVPEGVHWIKNDIGSAPGLIADYEGKLIICLPGPPIEIEPMFDKDIIPYLKKKIGAPWVIKSRVVKITGLPESRLDGMVRDLLNLQPPTTVGIYAKPGQVELKIMSKAADGRKAALEIAKIERKIRSRIKDHIFGYDDQTLEGAVGDILRKRGKTIAIAESCTGGLVTHRITNVSGSSDYLIMGVVAYSNAIKESMLGVSPKALKRSGAVSGKVALQMARGVKFLAKADVGLGITGIAGPAAGTKKKPVGLVYVALVYGKKQVVEELRFRGSREHIKWQSSQAALDIIRCELLSP